MVDGERGACETDIVLEFLGCGGRIGRLIRLQLLIVSHFVVSEDGWCLFGGVDDMVYASYGKGRQRNRQIVHVNSQ